jgi:hypothetical protein
VPKKLAPVHPGEVLREDFLIPMNLSPCAVARACGVPRTRIERLARERDSYYRRHRIAAVSLFRDHGGLLNEHSDVVRS